MFSAKENGSLTSKIAVDSVKSFLTRKVSPVCGKNKFGWGVILRPTGPYRAGNDQALKILSEWPRGRASPRLRRFGSAALKGGEEMAARSPHAKAAIHNRRRR